MAGGVGCICVVIIPNCWGAIGAMGTAGGLIGVVNSDGGLEGAMLML